MLLLSQHMAKLAEVHAKADSGRFRTQVKQPDGKWGVFIGFFSLAGGVDPWCS